MARTQVSNASLLACLLGVSALLAGCGPKANIYDAYALTEARRVAVMPGLGTPGPTARTPVRPSRPC